MTKFTIYFYGEFDGYAYADTARDAIKHHCRNNLHDDLDGYTAA